MMMKRVRYGAFGASMQCAIGCLLVLCALTAQAQTKGPVKTDAARGQQIASQVCAACHAADGNSTTPVNPKLAQQHPEYLVKQLQEYKSGKRKNAIMAGFAGGLSDEDINDLSAFYGSQDGDLHDLSKIDER